MARAARGEAGGATDAVINTADALRATAANAAMMAGVDVGHLVDTLRLTGRPGEPVTAAWIYDTARALAGAGYGSAPRGGPDPAVLAAEVAASRQVRLPGAPRGSARKRRRGPGMPSGGFGS